MDRTPHPGRSGGKYACAYARTVLKFRHVILLAVTLLTIIAATQITKIDIRNG